MGCRFKSCLYVHECSVNHLRLRMRFTRLLCFIREKEIKRALHCTF